MPTESETVLLADTSVAVSAVDSTTAMDYFTHPGAMDPLLGRIRAEVDAFLDMPWSMKAELDRAKVAAFAYRIARSKTYLETVGKVLADEVKLIPKKVDATRKHVRDTLDAWRDEVRAPLNKWEAVEESRKQWHLKGIEEMRAASNLVGAEGVQARRAQLAEVEAIIIENFEEFREEAAMAKAAAIKQLKLEIERREKYEADQAELAELREAKRNAEEQIRAEQAKREADERAEARANEDIARLETKFSAELEAAEKAKKSAEQAAEAEARRRGEAEAANTAETAATAARLADKGHRSRINGVARNAFITAGLTGEQATYIVTIIAQGRIPGVKIEY